MSNTKPKILITDDVEINRIILHDILCNDYEIEQAQDGFETISILLNSTVKPNLILLDIMMPNMDGFEVMHFIKASPLLCKIPIICITASGEERRALSEGSVDYISKPFEPEIVRLRVANQIELSMHRDELEDLVEKKTEELLDTRERFFDTMVNLIEYRSLESGEHSKRTRQLARVLATQLLKNEKYYKVLIEGGLNEFIKAVPLHDIGKIGIPDNVLLKPGKLTPEEFKLIEQHSVIGSEVVKTLMNYGEDSYLRHCYDICRSHHERWDGGGYPDRLVGDEIPLSARIVAVVDVYDALVSERCYKKALPHKEAVNIIKSLAGSQFDPEIVEAFLQVEQEFDECEHG